MPPPDSNGAKGFRWLDGLRPFDRSQLLPDILAGITLAALGIPEVMGYTKIIGTPVVTGLYTMLVPMLLFALLGSSRHLVVSADSATAAMVAAAFAGLSLQPYSEHYTAMAGLVALAVALMLLAARFLRAGFLADFLSRTVLVGFLTGVGIQVALGQLHGMLRLPRAGHGVLPQLLHNFQHLTETHFPSLAIALATLAVIWIFEKKAPRWPGALFALIGMILASRVFHWDGHGIHLVGTVPGGLPHFGMPDVSWQDFLDILPIAASCFIVILAQSAATSRAYALRDRERLDENTDLVGLAAANIGAGLGGTFVVNGSPTKTAMIDSAGGRSQAAHLATVAVVLLVLVFLTGPLAWLPEAVLAAIVFHIGLKLMDLRGLKDILAVKPGEFRVALATTATVVFIGVKEGILLALVLSLFQHVRRSYRPHVRVVMRRGKDHWSLEAAEPGKMILPGMVMFWFGSDLFYANASFFSERTRQLVEDSPEPVRWLVIDAGAITGLDYSAFRALAELKEDLDARGVTLAITRLSGPLSPGLSWHRLGLESFFGRDHVFLSRHECLKAYAKEFGICLDDDLHPAS